MKPLVRICLAALVLMCAGALAEDPFPKTLLTERGALLVSEDLSKPVASIQAGKANTTKTGWRWLSGRWEFVDGSLKGTQLPEDGRSAFVVYYLDFKEAIIQFDVRFEGCRQVFFRVQDSVPEHICRVMINPTGFTAQKDDHDHAGPDEAVPFGKAALPIQAGEWKTVLVEITGEEMVATIDGRSISGSHPLIAAPKASIDFDVTGDSASFRNIRVWEARPNPQWPENRRRLEAK